jgi:hypothetical protein
VDAHISYSHLLPAYIATGAAVTLLSLLVWTFVWVLRAALQRADKPLVLLFVNVRQRLPVLILPAVVLPTFLAAFTATKSAIPFVVGYTWDAFWAHIDVFIFGDDAWRIATEVLGARSLLILQWFYVVAWGMALAFISAFVALHASRRFVGTYFTAMFSTWLFGGVAIAYLMSAAGPVFAAQFDPSLSGRFAPLHLFLSQNLADKSPIRITQAYLLSAVDSHSAEKGGGISAFPSMHLGAAAIYVFAARRTIWFIPALLFWIVIFVCSAYFGYHYWIDGIAGAVVAAVCWIAAGRIYRAPANSA